jgi:hypothetical protein
MYKYTQEQYAYNFFNIRKIIQEEILRPEE